MQMTCEYDLVVRNGSIVDGSGEHSFEGDVAVKNGRIAVVGNAPGRGTEEIDATGCIVTPGFVDIHTHYDGQITWERRLAPSSTHGVTTVVMGNCGVGFAPVRAEHRNLLIKLLEGVEDIPEVVMAAGVPFNWESFSDYLDAIEKCHADIDFAAQIPHSPIRVFVMGQRGVDLEAPTDADLAAMRRIVTESIKAGALGVTTSRNLFHRFRDGRLAPCVNTPEDELTALALGLRDAGAGVFQLNPDMSSPASTEFALIRRLAVACGRPVSFTLVTGDSVMEGWRYYLSGLAEAQAQGIPIRGQFFPRPVGILFGLDLSYHPFSLNPSYRPIAELSLQDKVAAMRDPVMRRRLLSERPADINPQFVKLVERTEILFALGDPPNYLPGQEQSIAARARALGIDERELIYDELLADDGKAILYCPVGNMENGRMDAAAQMFDKPGVVLALGDGGAHYGMICDAAYPTFLLTQYVYGASEKRRLPIEQAIRMLTRETAEAVGLHDRGLARPGYKADLNIINPTRLHLHSPQARRDLPTGGRRLTQVAEGYEATIVSGTVTYRNGEATGKLPGRLVRGARPASNAL
jgi:N-acyl-D-amino-acid deacylase